MPDRPPMVMGFSLAANGSHKGGWRHPESRRGGSLDISMWTDIAKALEEAHFHYLFFADGAAVRTEAKDEESLSYHGRIDQFEPITLIATLAAATKRLGYVATASTSYSDPFTVARKFASLDHLSGGRVGWNVVTGWSEVEAMNFGREQHYTHAERYRRAEEFTDVVMGLWDSWGDEAFLRDKETGKYFDHQKMHVLNHKGEFFSVRGPLNITRSPQGYPVIAQAGASEPGKRLAARTADIVYTAQSSFDRAAKYYREVKALLPEYGRAPESVVIMPGIMPIIGRTQAEAEAKRDQLGALLHDVVGLGAILQSGLFGDLSGYDLDGPPPPPRSEVNGVKSIAEVWAKRIKDEKLTIRQLFQNLAISPGHWVVVGTPLSIADQMEEWYMNGACDGFSVQAPFLPTPVFDFIEMVVPELKRRGLFQTEYKGATLRESMGLERPVNSFEAGLQDHVRLRHPAGVKVETVG
jgi:FMN-dependent oxidoreductase (nitrilotriacetate monooxygenase family)